MQDITVEDIINTFKGKSRDALMSSASEDDFTLTIKAKKNWTDLEFKHFYYEYAKEYLVSNIIEFMLIRKIIKKYDFKLEWSNYIEIIDELNSEILQKEYINRYFWYYSSSLNEEDFLNLNMKSYFKFITKDSRIKFLNNFIKIENKDYWIKKYFTKEEIEESFYKNNTFLQFDVKGKNEEEEKNLKVFYNEYKEYMSDGIKFSFLMSVLNTGNLDLIKYFIIEEKIKILNKKGIIFNIFGQFSRGNVFDIIDTLKDMGIKFKENTLLKVKDSEQWNSIEKKDEFLLLLKKLKVEKEYKKLNRKFGVKKKELIIKI